MDAVLTCSIISRFKNTFMAIKSLSLIYVWELFVMKGNFQPYVSRIKFLYMSYS